MTSNNQLILSIFLILGFAPQTFANEYPDPSRYNDVVSQFEQRDAANPPPSNAYVVVGSSSVRGWHSTIERDLAPLPIIARGFGGSNMNDANHFIKRLVLNYKPKAILLYEGDNDVALGITPAEVVTGYQTFVAQVRAEMPDVPVYFMAIKPSVARWAVWPQMQQANAEIARLAQQDTKLHYIDVASPMLLASGEVRTDIFVEDDLHMNARGYQLWTSAVRSALSLPPLL